jgi:hypothetical protein
MLGKINCRKCEIGLPNYAYIIGENYYCGICFKQIFKEEPFDIKKLYKKSVTKRVLKKKDVK